MSDAGSGVNVHALDFSKLPSASNLLAAHAITGTPANNAPWLYVYLTSGATLKLPVPHSMCGLAYLSYTLAAYKLPDVPVFGRPEDQRVVLVWRVKPTRRDMPMVMQCFWVFNVEGIVGRPRLDLVNPERDPRASVEEIAVLVDATGALKALEALA